MYMYLNLLLTIRIAQQHNSIEKEGIVTMRGILVGLEIYIMILMAIILIAAPGYFLISRVAPNFGVLNPFTRITNSLIFGFALLNLASFTMAIMQIQVKIFYYVYVFVSIICVFALILNKSIRKILSRQSLTLIFVSFAGLWQFLPGILMASQAGAGMTMVTHSNNDISAYAGLTNEFLKTGFRADHHIASQDLNGFTKNLSWFGATSLLSFVSTLFSIPTWKATPATIGIAIAICVIGLSRLVNTLYKNLTTKSALLISTCIMLSALLTYIEGNYFLGQLLALFVATIILANALEFTRIAEVSGIVFLEVAAFTIAGIYTYSGFLLPFLALTLIYVIIKLLFNYSKVFLIQNIKYFAAILLGCIFSLPYFPIAIALMKNVASVNAGWQLPPLNPASMFIWPQTIGITLSKWTLLLSWATLFIIIFSLGKSTLKRNEDRSRIFFFSILVPLLIVTYILITKKGFEAYQSWKLESYFLPFCLAAILPLVVIKWKSGEKVLMLVLGLTLSTSMALWGTSKPTFVSSDLASLGNNQIVMKLKSLNVQIDPYFETMAAANVINGPQIYTNAISYYPTSFDPDACTLIHLGNTAFRYVQKLNNTYGLASSAPSKCSARLAFGTTLKFTTGGNTPIGSGWSTPEEWGTWTISNRAILELPEIEKSGNSHSLEISANGFVTPLHPSILVAVRINGKFVGNMNFDIAKPASTSSFAIPINTSKLHLDFEIDKPASPASLNISTDPRMLGFGLKSILFK